ncbi:MAG: ZIP family metal transporter, partial [Chitinophagia bacterium]|nr:ZIP family metal transporter [Chitinophagia bacterium]
MEQLEQLFFQIGPIWSALLATTFTWLLTALGASLVFFFKTMDRSVLDPMLGFTGGVMVAASFWSLLNPAIEISEKLYPGFSWLPAAVGFLLGALFIF